MQGSVLRVRCIKFSGMRHKYNVEKLLQEVQYMYLKYYWLRVLNLAKLAKTMENAKINLWK